MKALPLLLRHGLMSGRPAAVALLPLSGAFESQPCRDGKVAIASPSGTGCPASSAQLPRERSLRVEFPGLSTDGPMVQ